MDSGDYAEYFNYHAKLADAETWLALQVVTSHGSDMLDELGEKPLTLLSILCGHNCRHWREIKDRVDSYLEKKVENHGAIG